MPVLDFIVKAGPVGWGIIALGVFSWVLIYDRFKTLFFKLSMSAGEFSAKINTLILERKIDEAILLCSQLPEKPLARSFKAILEKSNRDDDSVFQAHDNALAENIPIITKRTHYLSMLANVATLLGLLGTIVGLIISFDAVAKVDPALKQSTLASGIAVSLYTTALGLLVAVPSMVAYSFLIAKQNQLVEELTEKCGKLAEMITGSAYLTLERAGARPPAPGQGLTPMRAAPSTPSAAPVEGSGSKAS